MNSETVIVFFIFALLNFTFGRILLAEKNAVHYTNLWILQVSKKDNEILEKLKINEGFETTEQEHLLPGLHLVIHKKHPQRGKYENFYLTNILLKYREILWAEQIYVKRIALKIYCAGKSTFGTSKYKEMINDKLFKKQWYLQDCRTNRYQTRYDINVLPVWHQYKIFGSGIKVIVVDGGIQTNHFDLEANYDAHYGYDFIANDASPIPRSSSFFGGYHGTQCAGIIAMQANNNICGVGIAPLVTLGAVRISSPKKMPTNLNEARAFMFRAEEVDISSNSWGPDDDGKTLDITARITEAALKEGIVKGRRAKGIVYVFAAGNGKQQGDTCACDNFANIMYTITVAGVKHSGDATFYSERCSNILVAAYSGDGNYGMWGNIVSTNLHNFCTTRFRGTSAAAPIVSGVVALILEANPRLTWREVQHVFAWTSEVAPLAHNKSWKRNKAGFLLSDDFGFGLVDTFNAVTFAKNMHPISSMNSCVLSIALTEKMVFHRKLALVMKVPTNGCQNLPSEVNYAEHIQLIVSVEHARRGAIQIFLESPSGTRAQLMEARWLDKSKNGLRRWLLDTVHFWGEQPSGVWSVTFSDSISRPDYRGVVTQVTLIIHGTKYKPPHYTTPRIYYTIT